ncbi:MAG TPA: hypothetical protein VF170_14755 [Planctomycetaceae bacterium]
MQLSGKIRRGGGIKGPRSSGLPPRTDPWTGYPRPSVRCWPDSAPALNHVDGPAAVTFLLGCVRQRVLRPDLRQRLRTRLEERVRREAGREPEGLRRAAAELARHEREVELAGRNLAQAETDEEYQVISKAPQAAVVDRNRIRAEVERLRSAADADPRREAEAALAQLARIEELASDEANLAVAAAAFDAVNARVYFRFPAQAWGKRTVNRVAGGVIRFGDAPPPVPTYPGPTIRSAVRPQNGCGTAGSGGPAKRAAFQVRTGRQTHSEM